MLKIALLSSAALVGLGTTLFAADEPQVEDVTFLGWVKGLVSDEKPPTQILSQEMYLQYSSNIFFPCRF